VELHHIAIRAVFGYAVLLALLRVSGKRTVAQGTPFDFVLALILGDMIDDLLWAEVPAARFTVAVGTLTLVHTLVSVACGRSERLARLLEGAPAHVVRHGRAQRKGLRSERISDRELERMLRAEGVPEEDWVEVRHATVEGSGQPTLSREPWAEAPRKADAPRLLEVKT